MIAIAVAMALYHMWAIAFGTPEAILFRGTHLLFALVLVFLIYRATTLPHDGPSDEVKQADDRLPTILDYLLVAASRDADRLSVRQLRIHRHAHLLHRRPVAGAT